MDEELKKIMEDGRKISKEELLTQVDRNIEEMDKWAKEQKGCDTYTEWHESVL